MRGVSFARPGFSREAQRTQSSSSLEEEEGGGKGDCLHLPSDRDEADWLCLDFARARRELQALVVDADAASSATAAVEEAERWVFVLRGSVEGEACLSQSVSQRLVVFVQVDALPDPDGGLKTPTHPPSIDTHTHTTQPPP